MLENTKRIDWDSYFLEIAKLIAKRSSCNRAFVGAVLVKHKQVIATGYNGGVSGLDNCEEAGHFEEDGHCIRTVHAEMNAILQCARSANNTDGSEIYVTHFPCVNCSKAIAQAGVTKVHYLYDYRISEFAKAIFAQKGIALIHHTELAEDN